MGEPSSDSAVEPAAAPPTSIPGNPSANPPILPLPSSFPSQSLLGRPPNPSAGLFYSAATVRAHPRGYAAPHMATLSNPAGYTRNGNPTAIVAIQPRGNGFQSDQGVSVFRTHHQRFQKQPIRPSLHHPRIGGTEIKASSAPNFTPSLAPPKISSFPSENSKPEEMDQSRDDGTARIYGRKVRLSEAPSGSLYGLCHSWIHNGLQQEIQPKFDDGAQLLPKPLPYKACDSTSLARKSLDREDEDTEPGEYEDSTGRNPSINDLLQSHIKRAKRVRACLREERFQRIERYKQRLALLLPLHVDSERSSGS